jgi:hypothetical protein
MSQEFTELPIPFKRPSEVATQLQTAIVTPEVVRDRLADDPVASREAIKARKVFDVTHFGAKGDGEANDTAAINLAIVTAYEAGGGDVYFPPGEYFIRSATNDASQLFWDAIGGVKGPRPCLLLLKDVSLVGAGPEVTRLTMDSDNQAAHIKGFALSDFKIIGLHLIGNRPVGNIDHSSGEVEAVDLKDGCRRFEVGWCIFENIINEAIDHDVASGQVTDLEKDGVGSWVHDCRFVNVGGTGIHNGNWMLIERCVFQSVAKARYQGFLDGLPGSQGQGAVDGSGIALRIKDCVFDDCARLLHVYSNPVGAGSRDRTLTVIERCVCRDSLAPPVAGGTFVVIRDSFFSGEEARVGTLKAMYNCRLVTTKTNEANVSACMITVGCEFVGFGVQFNVAQSGAIFSGNKVDCRTRTTSLQVINLNGNNVNDLVISDNLIMQNSTSTEPIIGTNSTVNQQRNRIINNHISGAGNHHIRVVSNSVVSGNICIGGLIHGVTVRLNNNIVTGNILDRPINVISGSTNNVIENNLTSLV